MTITATTINSLTREEKDAIGRIWATDDAGVTYWFASLADVLPWMQEHDPDTFAAIVKHRKEIVGRIENARETRETSGSD